MLIGTFLLIALIGVTSAAEGDGMYDSYGGWMGIRTEATGHFRTERIHGVWWLIDPEGHAFVSKGVNHISFTADHAPDLGYAPYGRATEAKYDNAEAWAEAAIQRLRGWRFNTVGAWSNPVTFGRGMPYTTILDLAARMGDWQRGIFPDVFSPQFEQAVVARAERLCKPVAQDPYLIGYFLDNELRWDADWRSNATLFEDFLSLPSESPGKQALVWVMAELYGSVDALNRAWGATLRSFEDLLPIRELDGVSEALAEARQELRARRNLELVIPPKMAEMYLNYTYGDIDEVNAALGTDADSFEDLLTESFCRQLTRELSKVPLPRQMVRLGVQMVYGSLDEANRAFQTQTDSFDQLVDRLLEHAEPSPVAQELERAEASFLRAVADRYFGQCYDAICQQDPNHLILGCRFAGYAPGAVLEAMAPYVDVVSLNHYGPVPPGDLLERVHNLTGKPLLITEFSFKAMDSALLNTRGAGAPVETQQDRADGFQHYVEALMAHPFAVGYHWFEHADEPAEGRFDGENSNYGVVNIQDEPWETLVARMTEVNGMAEQLHSRSEMQMPVIPAGHPRVYVRPEQLPAIRAKLEHPEFADAWRRIQRSDATICRAFVHLMTGDPEPGRKAIQQWLKDVDSSEGDMDRIGRVFGNLLHQGAMVYDWCYDLLDAEQKQQMIDRLEAMAATHGPGYPANPDGHAVVGHDTEGWLLTGQLPAGAAIYDETPTMYEAAAQLFFRHFVPVRNFLYRSHMHHQGDSYITTRFQHDQAAAWLFRRLGAGDVFSPDQRYIPYQILYHLRPDGLQLRSGDTFDQAGTDSRKRLIAMMTGSYYGDPVLLGAMELFGRYGPEGQIFDLLFREPDVATEPLDTLPLTKFFPPPMGEMVARTGWTLGTDSRDAVVQMRIGETFFGNHQCKDFGTFQIYYRGALAVGTGLYDSYGNDHWRNYYHQTISKNGLLILDPAEQPKRGTANDGGQRWPQGSDHPKHLDTLLSDDYQMGKVTAHAILPDADQPAYSYIAGDITNAYAAAKAKRVTRSMVMLHTPDTPYPGVLVLFDRVVSTQPDFRKTWLLHSLEEPTVDGRTITLRRTGEAPHGGEYGGKLVTRSLLPERVEIDKIGGPGREFWVAGKNYPAEIDRKGVEPGAWRVEISAAGKAKTALFLHTLTMMDIDQQTSPEARLLQSESWAGVQLLGRTLIFSRSTTPLTELQLNLAEPTQLFACDLAPGTWEIRTGSGILSREVQPGEGVLLIALDAGHHTMRRVGENGG